MCAPRNIMPPDVDRRGHMAPGVVRIHIGVKCRLLLPCKMPDEAGYSHEVLGQPPEGLQVRPNWRARMAAKLFGSECHIHTIQCQVICPGRECSVEPRLGPRERALVTWRTRGGLESRSEWSVVMHLGPKPELAARRAEDLPRKQFPTPSSAVHG